MRKFKSGRLVRDKIIEGVIKSGNKAKFRKLNKSEYIKELKKKLLEEAHEIKTEKKKEEIIKEIADLQEVIDNLAKVFTLSKQDIKKLQTRKNKKAGSFKKRFYLEEVEVSDNSDWLDYYLSRPKLFPEIKKR